MSMEKAQAGLIVVPKVYTNTGTETCSIPLLLFGIRNLRVSCVAKAWSCITITLQHGRYTDSGH